jgi:lysophospholipase L1-like esterase
MSPRHKRLVVILCFGALFCSLIVFYVQFFMRRPIGEGPAGPSVASEPFEKAWSNQNVKLVGIGDSITAGLGAKSPDHTFFNRLIANPRDEYEEMNGKCLASVLPQLSHENLAISGSTSLEHLSVIEERLPIHSPDVFGLVVMTTGGNDLIHSYGRMPPKECAMYGATLEQAMPWIAAYAERLDQMLSKIETAFPGGCEIYLADIYDPTDGVGDAPSVYLPHWPDGLAIHAKYNEAIEKAADLRPNVHRVPLHKTFLGHGAHCRQFWRAHYDRDDPHYWFYDNIEDPNDRGYDAIRRVFLNSIVEHTRLRQSQPAAEQVAK